MKVRHFFTLCVCATLFCLAFQVGVSAEPEVDRRGRRDPFTSLLRIHSHCPCGPLPSEKPQETILQQYEINQFRVVGIVLGELGHHAVVLAPDGKRYMISNGTLIGRYDGTVTEIASNSIRVTEILRFEDGNGNIVIKEEAEKTLFLDPLKESKAPESRFVVLDK